VNDAAGTMENLSRAVAITGIAETAHAKSMPDRTAMSLAIEAGVHALRDAGVDRTEVDGVITSEGIGWGNPRGHIELSEYLGIFPKRLCTSVPMGGATPGFALELARWAVGSGRARHVLVVGAGKMGDQPRTAVGHGATQAVSTTFRGHSPTYEQIYGPTMVTYHAAVAARHMHEFGTTSEQLAAVAVACRKHASLNPAAVMRQPITVDDVLESRMISSPLHLLDCCIATDGGCGWVVSAAELAHDRRHPPVWVLGAGSAQSAYFMGALAAGDGTYDMVRTVGKKAADLAFDEAGITREDVDVIEDNDSFTITALLSVEDYGFCAKGEGGPLAGSGALELGGRLPMNTHGGTLSCSHFGPGAFLHFVEAVRQLRGDCGDRQVPDARIALAASAAGVVSTHSLAILARD
jgi:acetyl-CoA acetyltransferase